MGKRSIAGAVVYEYMTKYPKMLDAKKRFARFIYNKEPELFRDVEQVRDFIRYYSGAKGKAQREALKNQDLVQVNKGYAWNALPDGDEVLDWDKPVLIEGDRCLLLSDIHIPYHDLEALNLALTFGLKEDVDCIVLNGDTLDCYQQSRWGKDPRQRDWKYELDLARKFFHALREEFPKAKIYFKWGNHEVRYEQYLITKAPELFDLPELQLSAMLHFEKLGIVEVPSMHFMKFGKLNVFHGHETGKGVFSPVNAARGQFLKTLESCISGHYHQPSTHTQKTGFKREPITVWSTGCLCKLSASGYSAINKWSHGFALLRRLDEAGNFEVVNKRIYDGQIWSA